MGGYGGALKQLAIGCASAKGKALIHSAGKTDDRFKTWEQHADKAAFPEAMADAARGGGGGGGGGGRQGGGRAELPISM